MVMYQKDNVIPDDGVHTILTDEGRYKLAITKTDFVENVGFGRNSVYITFDEAGTPSKTVTHDKPLIFPLT